jgi:DNA invertase Pin-like site-specific DNA recombinase
MVRREIRDYLTAERVAQDGHALDDDLCFLDDGVSGSTLLRPALERLRDTAYVGNFQKLYVHSPDRLARRYAYQVLLVDELQKHGVEIEFRNLSVYDVAALGERFDLVIFMGVFYHLRHPLLALDLLHAHAVGDLLLFQTLT